MAKSLEYKVVKWQQAHPDGTVEDCVCDLCIREKTVRKWWRDSHDIQQECCVCDTETLVKEWFQEHPHASIVQCANSLNLNHGTVNAYHRKFIAGQTYQRVVDWKRDNPGKTQTECAKALGISRQVVYNYWHISEDDIYRPVLNQYLLRDKQARFEAVKEWLATHDSHSAAECARDLGVNPCTINGWFDKMPNRVYRPYTRRKSKGTF